MRTGKLPEHTFKRSVLNPIRYKSARVEFRADIGHDGAVCEGMVTAMATTAFYYAGNEIYAMDNALNNVIAAGGIPYGISVGILMPEHSEEATLRKITDNLYKKAQEYQIDILAGHTELVPTVINPTIMITAYGKKLWENQHKLIEPGMDIIMTKWPGLYGGSILAKLKKNELITRYPKSYIEVAESYYSMTSLMPELEVIKEIVKDNHDRILVAHDVASGGLFGCLWQMLSACNCGATFMIESIKMKQEIIEVSEFFDINPYMLHGQGSLLMISHEGKKIVEMMRRNDIEANIIGKTTKEKDRKILIGEEERFLVPPKGDALNEVFYGQKIPV